MNVNDKVRAIAANLDGLHERFTRPTVTTPYGHAGNIVGTNGAELFIRAERGRLIITGVYPDRLNYGRGADSVKITVDETRPPAAIAREILRRVLPAYLPQLATVQERVKEGHADELARAEARQIFLNHPLIDSYGSTGDLIMRLPGPAMHHITFRLNHDGSTVNIDRGHLASDVFLALAQAAKRTTSGDNIAGIVPVERA